jgi:nitroreductase
MTKHAEVDHPVHETIRRRWSPYVFADRDVPLPDLRSLFEAARWAPSSFNEQPWRYIVARRVDREEFDRLLSCLTEGNRLWARHSPVLVLGTARTLFTRNGKPNRAALHDLGAASAYLSLEATHRGLAVHQMAGIDRECARLAYRIPEEFEVVTGLAIGYAGERDEANPRHLERDRTPRTRRPLPETVFEDRWGDPAAWLPEQGG